MKYQKWFATLSLCTVCLFAVSYACAKLGPPKQEGALYPLSIAKRYAEQAQHWFNVNQTETVANPEILTIQIETDLTDVQFESSTGVDIKVSLNGKYLPQKDGSENILQLKQKAEVLTLTTDEGGRSQGYSFADDSSHGTLLVTFPARIKTLKVKSKQGKLRGTRGLGITALDLETISGSIVLAEVKSESIAFKTSSGEVSIDGVFQKLTGSSHSGEVQIGSGMADPEMNLSSASGNIELNFNEQPNVKLNFATQSGSLKVDSSAGNAVEIAQSYQGVLSKGKGQLNLSNDSGHCLILSEDRD